MSLLSQWNSIKSSMNSAISKSAAVKGGVDKADSSTENIDTSSEEYLRSLFENQNKWRCTRWSTTSSSAPTFSTINNLFAAATMLKSHDTSQNWAWADSYIGMRECYVYCTQDYALSTSFWTDDHGRIYLNETSVATSTSCTSQSVTLNFKKGLNHVVIMFQEGSGGDAAYLNTNLANQSWVKWMYANYKM